jgi:lipopolysaccharide/colanic/teichoic acid biosynthesis glycosyltransferase
VEQFDEELRLRHRVRPGLTGLWQVEARDNPSFRPYRRLDLFYVENWSLLLDVVVLILTAEVVLARGLRFLRDRRPSELRARRESTADGR